MEEAEEVEKVEAVVGEVILVKGEGILRTLDVFRIVFEGGGSGPVKRPIDFLANIQCFFTNILPIRINRLLANLICQMNLPRGL